jgi:hypothetical protein
MKNLFTGSWLVILLFGVCFDLEQKKQTSIYKDDDPLPSWNDGKVKNAIIGFVET